MNSGPDNTRLDALSALRIPHVAGFAFGRAASTLASQFVSVAVGWELYERTNDPWALGLVGVAQVAPALVLMLPAGSIADRFPRRNVAILAQSLLTSAALGLALVSVFHGPIELIYVLLMLSGIGRAFAAPSITTLLAQLLTPREFQNAYAWLVSSGQLASIAGPAIGGLLIALSGASTPSYVAALVGQIVFIATLSRMPVVAPSPNPAKRTVGDLFAGVGFIRRNRIYLAAITLDLFGVLLGGAVALLPIFAKDILQVGPVGLGFLRSAPSVGAVLTALFVTRLPPWKRPGRVLLLVVAGFGLATIGFGLSQNIYFSLFCLALTGAFDSISMVIRGTLEQALTPERLRGRVAAVNSLFIGLSNEMGAFESGATAALFGPVLSVAGGGIGTLLIVGIVAMAFPMLVRVGPLHSLKPLEDTFVVAADEKVPTGVRA